ncbi:MAG TPA: dihydroorotate dehydrogenase electron transfer subunit [Limnochordales bacterium]
MSAHPAPAGAFAAGEAGGAAGRPTLVKAPVVRARPLAEGVVWLELQAPELAGARPGQFVHVTCREPGSLDPLLRRPFSLADARPERGEVAIVVKAVGRATRWLAARRPGDVLDVMGPLGHPFSAEPGQPPEAALLVGGGTGLAPLLFLARRLAAAGGEVAVAAGFRRRQDVILVDEFAALGARVVVATEDGSVGRPGTAAQVAEGLWPEARSVFACGPWGLLQAVERLRRADPRPLEVAVETMMGCGAGVCLSCVVPWRRREGYRVTGWARACVEGPVFDARDLVWERCPGGGG